jgi:hypothetical protein
VRCDEAPWRFFTICFKREFSHDVNLRLTVITLTVGVIYTTVFEYKNQVMFNMTVFLTVDLVVKLTLAFSIQTKTSFLEY